MNVLELTIKLFTYLCHLLIAFANSLDPDQAQRFVGYLLNWLTDCNQICMGIGFVILTSFSRSLWQALTANFIP